MMYAYKLPNGLTRLSGKAAYYASVSDAYAELAKVAPAASMPSQTAHPAAAHSSIGRLRQPHVMHELFGGTRTVTVLVLVHPPLS